VSAALAGRVVLVVGGTAGIGLATVRCVAAAGATVAVAGRRGDLAQSIAAESGGLAVTCDVRSDSDCVAMVEAVIGAYSRLDAVVYAAGVSPLADLQSADGDLWRTVLDTVLVGAAQTLRAAAAELLEQDGRFIALSSNMVGRPWPGMVPYSSARAGLEEMIRGARLEMPALRLTRVQVGPTSTGFESHFDSDTFFAYVERWRAVGLLSSTLRSLWPDEVAAAIVSTLTSASRIDDLSVQPYAPR
jgi:NAD(P)-dependent dehydrogenase (short-subunit alcohol dehydrogenase family)